MTSETLSYEVGAYLGLPRDRRQGKAYQIVRAVIGAITAALQRGESVKVRGVGIFKVRTRPSQLKTCSDFQGNTPLNHYLARVPARRYVHFAPSKTLLRSLNVS